jgi:hypothetical protein
MFIEFFRVPYRYLDNHSVLLESLELLDIFKPFYYLKIRNVRLSSTY